MDARNLWEAMAEAQRDSEKAERLIEVAIEEQDSELYYEAEAMLHRATQRFDYLHAQVDALEHGIHASNELFLEAQAVL